MIYEKSIATKMNDREVMSTISISQKPSEIEAWFQRTTNRKWSMANQWSRDQ